MMHSRHATPEDAQAIAYIYNQGIADRVATFETRKRSPEEICAWFDGVHPVVVVEADGKVIAFAAASTYKLRECYSGIAEFSVYVAREARRKGVGSLAMSALIMGAEQAGFWKLLSRIFVENLASRALVAAHGFREVGIYEKHARLDGVWRDVVIVERLILTNIGSGGNGKALVLVLCTGNSARSQMAEGLLREMAGARFEVFSAGSKPSTVNPSAIMAMKERGIDISWQRSKHLDEFRQQPFDYVITVCDNAAESCPLFPGKAQRIHWSFPDPAAAEGTEEERLARFRQVRDSIEVHLSEWLAGQGRDNTKG